MEYDHLTHDGTTFEPREPREHDVVCSEMLGPNGAVVHRFYAFVRTDENGVAWLQAPNYDGKADFGDRTRVLGPVTLEDGEEPSPQRVSEVFNEKVAEDQYYDCPRMEHPYDEQPVWMEEDAPEIE